MKSLLLALLAVLALLSGEAQAFKCGTLLKKCCHGDVCKGFTVCKTIKLGHFKKVVCVPCGRNTKKCCPGHKCKDPHYSCQDGRCKKCGLNGGVCCGHTCKDPHYKCEGGKCVPKCGGNHEKCCTTGKACDDDHYSCQDKTCKPCGLNGGVCCGHTCKDPHYKCERGKCVPKCGGDHEKCCTTGKACDNDHYSCQGGKCKPCGSKGEKCCGHKCKEPYRCSKKGKCKEPCGGPHQKCCGRKCDKGYKCKGFGRNRRCVKKKPKCGRKGQRCCKGHRCKWWWLKCSKKGYCKVKRKFKGRK